LQAQGNAEGQVVVTENNFDKVARTWDDDPQKVSRARNVAAHIRKRVPLTSDMRALEYGCGTGLLSFALKDDLGRISLADSSKEMLSVLKEKIERADIENMFPLYLNLVKGDICLQKFDLIYSLMVLHHVKDIRKVLGALGDLLCDGGYLCVADLDKEDGSFHGSEFEGHNGFERDELTDIITPLGFRNIRYDDCFVFRKKRNGEGKDYSIFFMSCRLGSQ